MDKVWIGYSVNALQFRELINIAVATFAVTLCFLLARYVVDEIGTNGYRRVEWPVKFSIGLFFIFAGEFLRSSTIWEILHFQGERGNYATDIPVLLVSLILIMIGALCAIRVMTPVKWGNYVWALSLVEVLTLMVLSYLL